MKKAISLILAIMMCLSLCACGGKGSKMSKEEMLSAASAVTSSEIYKDTQNNLAKAKQLYCEKVLEVTGLVSSVQEKYVEVGIDLTVGGTVVDVYLPIEELVLLERGQQITVVGKTSDEFYESTSNVGGGTYTKKHYVMPSAYLVADTFEVSGTIKSVNTSFYPAYNFQISGDNSWKLVYFAKGEDLSKVKYNASVTIKAKIFRERLSDKDFEAREAVVVG